jgi:tungstate transport system substrate-binding protein
LIASGAGMATTLRQANELRAYTLTDRATFVQLQPRLSLRLLVEGDPALLNTYAIVVRAGPRAKAAMTLADWLSYGRGRQRIREFELGGRPAFTPWPDACKRDTPDALPCGY